MKKVNDVEIEDTYCEAFDGLYTRLQITAGDKKRLKQATEGSTALPCTVFNESEGGVETYLNKTETIDGRPGSIIQIWVNKTGGKEKLEHETAKRIRQGILVVPETKVFNQTNSNKKIDTMKKIGHCGDGYEWTEKRHNREMINIPIMMGEFLIEKQIAYNTGIMGGNIWYYCDSNKTALKAGDAALKEIKKIKGTTTPFQICSAGSKVETNYPEIGPTTNHPYCPTLKNKIKQSKVPKQTKSIPEIVINGTNKKAIKKAMKKTIQTITQHKGVQKISAGNFGGELGKHKIHLHDLI
ncbi:Formylmethanofuran:tetrahydromethanopterin formyltransferase Ftr [Methanonatronarchaeum thermophilum]|uniref:Formylmethanofuran:tetrahydromethanopterin formyltransferase Ftr n=1 Tax=Methanonatronarchaeum thermophilum TaxID=1927129 RepID=A0A1Y3GGH6_9EURY|nr:formylmethanofuran--tetrahydromethanopterin N-formyltransferase [Methanonatronarchaeum thermophilum]OUJ18476.1 Formylmethanofuran:tetrahydromethanopterin formyltransferase Ftr [Methanonatronarchaeum thermophilum]